MDAIALDAVDDLSQIEKTTQGGGKWLNQGMDMIRHNDRGMDGPLITIPVEKRF